LDILLNGSRIKPFFIDLAKKYYPSALTKGDSFLVIFLNPLLILGVMLNILESDLEKYYQKFPLTEPTLSDILLTLSQRRITFLVR
jgi:hypothetical protein